VNLRSLILLLSLLVLCASEALAQQGAPPAPAAEQAAEPAPPAETKPPEPCNWACQIDEVPFAPGPGGGTALGQNQESPVEYKGLELGRKTPAAEDLFLNMQPAQVDKF
jgi:hypothetical protein